ncbi:hypothetical protein [Pedobacter frigoris]|uniref:DUF4390 domain-containing protein n=1 Tax=Pedobacter frigoris TaxID=2571272 RepID=A0A4U1CNH0_9SPHI|nr:hypothetical protein [Pedobacter frigoris]TKC06954.1 hypothetical protein FA047_06695 [Pedobacter frigoris]
MMEKISLKIKKILACISSIFFCLLLCGGAVTAQSGSEIKFNVMDDMFATDKNLVSVSAIVNAKQSAEDGIHFSVVVKNNSDKTLFINNTASQLFVSLFNEFGFDITVKSVYQRSSANERDGSWKFRSESVFPSKLYTNGKEEKIDIKMRQYFEVPGGGTSRVDLIIKDVKKVENTEDSKDQYLKPIVKLNPGKYKLQMFLGIISKDKSKSGGLIAGFHLPSIDIDYTR